LAIVAEEVLQLVMPMQWMVLLLLLGLWLLPGVLTCLVLLGFIVKQWLLDRASSAPRDDAKLLLAALLLGFILLPLMIAAPLSGRFARTRIGARKEQSAGGGDG